jgi:hypothetical protein
MAEVETQGMGQVERIADRAALQLSYVEQAKDRTSAASALANRVGAVESALARDGMQVRDRQLAVQDLWDGKRRAGARASQSYQVRITDLDVLNDVIAELMVTEPTTLRGPFWELAEQGDAVREAQRDAVRDAQRRAEGYAEVLGCRLGPLSRIVDSGIQGQPMRTASIGLSYGAREKARPDIAELSLEPQLVTVTATCKMTWEIGQSGPASQPVS